LINNDNDLPVGAFGSYSNLDLSGEKAGTKELA
jgi:hypothetical protein